LPAFGTVNQAISLTARIGKPLAVLSMSGDTGQGGSMRGVIKTVRKYGMIVYVPQIVDKYTGAVMYESIFMSYESAWTWVNGRI
jgi:hypothetical protein